MNLVNGHEKRTQLWYMQQEIVDGKDNISATLSHSSDKAHSVGTPKGMVGNDDGRAAEGDALRMDHLSADL